MAIFGKNGAWAAALYLATIWGVYSFRDAGFHSKEGWAADLAAIQALVDRKRVAEATGGKEAVARVVAQIREGRLRAAATGKFKPTAEFQKAYMKQTTFVR